MVGFPQSAQPWLRSWLRCRELFFAAPSETWASVTPAASDITAMRMGGKWAEVGSWIEARLTLRLLGCFSMRCSNPLAEGGDLHYLEVVDEIVGGALAHPVCF